MGIESSTEGLALRRIRMELPGVKVVDVLRRCHVCGVWKRLFSFPQPRGRINHVCAMCLRDAA